MGVASYDLRIHFAASASRIDGALSNMPTAHWRLAAQSAVPYPQNGHNLSRMLGTRDVCSVGLPPLT